MVGDREMKIEITDGIPTVKAEAVPVAKGVPVAEAVSVKGGSKSETNIKSVVYLTNGIQVNRIIS